MRFEPTGYLLAADSLIVPGRVVLDCAAIDDAASTAIAYLFRFRAGRLVSSTTYASLDDAIVAADVASGRRSI